MSALAEPPVDRSWEVEVFYDGGCPHCRREIALLRRWDRRRRIRFTDLAEPSFVATDTGIEMDRLLAEIHGRLPDGSLIRGVEVFRRLYAAVGWGWLVAVTRWPGVRHALEFGYRIFARHRLRLTGRCGTENGSTGCQVRSRS